MEAWEALVERYRGEREVCNCRQAWYNRSGKKRLSVPASPRIYKGYQGVNDPDHHSKICEGGCTSNIALCREEIARSILHAVAAERDECAAIADAVAATAAGEMHAEGLCYEIAEKIRART